MLTENERLGPSSPVFSEYLPETGLEPDIETDWVAIIIDADSVSNRF